MALLEPLYLLTRRLELLAVKVTPILCSHVLEVRVLRFLMTMSTRLLLHLSQLLRLFV